MIFFSQKLIETIKKSAEICGQEKAAEILPRHLLAGLEQTKGGLAFDILVQVKSIAKKKIELKTNPTLPFPLHKDARAIIQRAVSMAFQKQHHYVGTEHLLASLLKTISEKGSSKNPLNEKIEKHLETILRSSSNLPYFSKIFQMNDGKIKDLPFPDAPASALDCFATELTNAASQKEINPVIGREKEIERMIQILCRKDKNNPLILGEAGVGKTALVEGLAKKILNGEVPPILLNKRILNLDMGLIVAGAIYRGEFENRMKAIMDEVEHDPNVILFIDELHNIIGAGSAHGSMDAANLLKPLLARGKLRCIGATTPDEYKKFIETDAALERRFQPIYLCEPTAAETLTILQGVKENYRTYNHVGFTDDALEAAVLFSNRYLQDKLQPDKAIDLIDEAEARIKIKEQSADKKLREIFRLEKQLSQLKLEKEKAVAEENFNYALKIKEKEKRLALQIKNLEDEQEKEQANISAFVSRADILSLIAQKTNIPLADLEKAEHEQLIRVAEQLKTTILGQTAPIEEIIRAISYAKLGLADENRPLASFLFLGPSGVGKTFAAQKIAEHILPNKESFIHLDMSEFNEKFQATKLIGAPAGYVGYREGNKFTDVVKKHPYCLILFDEIEKAHPEVLDLLLQILEYGHLTDSVGKKVNFKNAILIMTSNILSDRFSKNKMGFGETSSSVESAETKETILPELKKQFKQEFINRLDNIVIFNELDKTALALIAEQLITALVKKMAEKGIGLAVAASVATFIAELASEQIGRAHV